MRYVVGAGHTVDDDNVSSRKQDETVRADLGLDICALEHAGSDIETERAVHGHAVDEPGGLSARRSYDHFEAFGSPVLDQKLDERRLPHTSLSRTGHMR